MLLESDAPECVAFDRVFPIFGDESILLTRSIEPGNGLFLDIGTGSGVQALVAAARGWTTVGTDVNLRALACAHHNATRNGLTKGVQWCAASLLHNLPVGAFDRVVANPPFLPSPSDASIPLSSDGGRNGLKVVGPLVKSVRRHLKPGGVFTLLAVSIGNHRRTLVEQRMRESFDLTRDSIIMLDLYGEALPLADLADCYRGLPGVETWMKSLRREGLCELRYLLFVVRREGRAYNPIVPALEKSEFSGGWQERLTRYRAWAEALRELRHTEAWFSKESIGSRMIPTWEFR